MHIVYTIIALPNIDIEGMQTNSATLLLVIYCLLLTPFVIFRRAW